ncbi:hypothetical protein GJA_2256 [Janthinobacterium agaricidamnosum NBRC 102515 = DSM 9628]|uniref:Uncharacterized protein n=1 Tax=Janthinobacterium agaricidamnosum NBRC 102515 = DSM 9628 TaxID=1349767 RepID=W0V4U2_9BURK|nr:hypothetical protein GJA_2256 [Janthinobacterium agaricidamnosum NBRC 102515 = DSM 9628]
MIVLAVLNRGDRCGHVSLLQYGSVFLYEVYSYLTRTTQIRYFRRFAATQLFRA